MTSFWSCPIPLTDVTLRNAKATGNPRGSLGFLASQVRSRVTVGVPEPIHALYIVGLNGNYRCV